MSSQTALEAPTEGAQVSDNTGPGWVGGETGWGGSRLGLGGSGGQTEEGFTRPVGGLEAQAHQRGRGEQAPGRARDQQTLPSLGASCPLCSALF